MKFNSLMGDLYSIIGFYLPDEEGITPFGGFLAMNSKQDFFVGKIVDEYGDSIIKGKLLEKELIFFQQYSDDEDKIKHEANYNPNLELWEGMSSFPDGSVEEFSCRILKNFSKIYFEGLNEKAFLLDNQLYEIIKCSDIEDIHKN